MQPVKPSSYSTAEAAQLLGVSVPTVQRWVDSGHLKAWKTVGGHRRIDASSVRKMAESGDELESIVPAAPSRLRVMIVDDNIDDRDVLTALINAALPGSEIRTAENGFEALLAVRAASPDVMITDIAMPHMNGVEMVRHLSSEPGSRSTVILAVSSQSPNEIRALGDLPEGVGFIPKPIDPDVFIATIRQAVAAAKTAIAPTATDPLVP